MSEAEHPARKSPEHHVTVDDLRQLIGASTPHFALQIRNRIARLVEHLDADDPARRLGEQEIARLQRLAYTGEVRGADAPDGLRTLPSLGEDEPTRPVSGPTRG